MLPRVFVISPPKTVSQAVHAALRTLTGARVIHAHWVSGDMSLRNIKVKAYQKQLAALLALSDRSVRHLVFTMVRDPVARHYSDMFHRCGAVLSTCAADHDFDALVPKLSGESDHILQLVGPYYERELEPLGIDITRLARTSAGYFSGECAGRRVILLRVEEIADQFQAAVQAEFGGGGGLPTKNLAGTYGSVAAYERLKRRFRLPDEVVSAMYAHPVIQHVYSAAEIEQMRAKWEAVWSG